MSSAGIILQVRGCGLTAASPSQLALWNATSPDTGLINTIRVLDLGQNPDLSFSPMEILFGLMKLWEL